jgi:NAD(P)-dependent dehydrogenase (short-subunit alcohol dehydrogenase family)
MESKRKEPKEPRTTLSLLQQQVCVQEYGTIDVLVLNAVVNPTMGALLDAPPEAISKILDVNIKSTLMLVAEAHPILSPLVRCLSVPAALPSHPHT